MTHNFVRAAFLACALAGLVDCSKPAAQQTGPTYTIDNLCSQLDGSFRKWQSLEYGACGAPLTDADLDHQSPLFLMGSSPVPAASFASFTGDYETIGQRVPRITCQGDLKDDYEKVKESVKAGRMTFDAAQVDACIKAGQDAKAKSADVSKLADSCAKIFAGAVAEAGDCNYSFECTGEMYCRTVDATVGCAGKCSPPLPIGAACLSTDVCAKNSACSKGSGTNYTCTALPGDGQQCSDGCVEGFYCDGATQSAKGTCKAYVAENGDCSGTGAQCAAKLTCRDNKCQQPFPLSQLGEPCFGKEGRKCDSTACLICDGGDLTNPGACKPIAKLGETCIAKGGTDSNGALKVTKTCDRFGLSHCDEATNTCVMYKREGEACVTTATKASDLAGPLGGDCLYMDNFCKRASASVKTGVCAPYPKLGEACADKPDMVSACPTGSYCKGLTSTANGACSALEADGTVCTEDAVCASGICAKDAQGKGACGQKAPIGAACVETMAGDMVCASDATCDTNTNKCVALAALAAACTDDAECASGKCETNTGKCAMVCDSLPGTSCWTGLDWFARYVFASGTLVFFAIRRRRNSKA